MVLTSKEESLIGLIRQLPSDEAAKVFNWAQRLSELAGAGAIDWSDSWSDEDIAEASRAAMNRFDEQEQ